MSPIWYWVSPIWSDLLRFGQIWSDLVIRVTVRHLRYDWYSSYVWYSNASNIGFTHYTSSQVVSFSTFGAFYYM